MMKTEAKNKGTKDTNYNSKVTKHDLEILAQDEIHGDGGDDQQLRERKDKIDFEGKDLDVPGSNKAKKKNNPSHLGDEENRVYSQGGDRKENLERDDAADTDKL